MEALVNGGLICTTRRVATCGLVIMYLCGQAPGAVAADSAFAIETGVGHTDNIGRTATDKQNSIINTAGTLFYITDVTRRIDANISGILEYQRYSGGGYPAQVVGSANAQLKLMIIPEQFEWKFSDYFGQSTREQAEAVTPSNRENINFVSTGPLFTIRMGSGNRLTMEGNYSEVSYQYSDLNNQRYRGAVALEHDLSAASRVSLNVQSTRISYDDAISNPPFDQQEAFIHYQAAGVRTTLELNLGYTRVKQTTGTNSHPLFRLNASRVTSRNSTLSVFLNREILDSGRLFQTLQTSLVSNQTTQVVQPQSPPFTTTYGGLLWKLTEGRSSLVLSVARYKDSYQFLAQYDQTRTVAHGDFERQLSPTIQVYSTVDLWKSLNASELGGDTTDRNYVVGITKRVGRRLSLDFQYDRLDRTAGQTSNSGKVNEIWFRVYYGSSAFGGGASASRVLGGGISPVH